MCYRGNFFVINNTEIIINFSVTNSVKIRKETLFWHDICKIIKYVNFKIFCIMKKMIFVFVAIATLFVLTSCNKEKKIMEDTLVSALKSPSSYKFIDFKEVETVTLADEVEDRLEHFNFILEYDIKPDIETATNAIKNYKGNHTLVSQFQQCLNETNKRYTNTVNLIQYLNNIKTKYPNLYNKPTFKVYELTYEAVNSFGASLKDTCYGRFNMKGELVAIKFEEDGSWNLLGNFFSIPDYYNMIKGI